MDRRNLIELFRKGMNYPSGRHRFWISRCFEITVRPDSLVQLDEYEGFVPQGGESQDGRVHSEGDQLSEMFHVGRSVLNLKSGRVIEEQGKGWGQAAQGEKKS